MKLIKLSETHYIVVDDSEIKESDFALNVKIKRLNQARFMFDSTDCKKITHSTQPLEQYYGATDGTLPFVYHKIKPLSLSEVEEAVYGYNVEKMAEQEIDRIVRMRVESPQRKKYENIWIKGFKAHKELMKDKFFTIEDIEKAMIERLSIEQFWEKCCKSLLPKTEWEVEFDEQGKLKLI